MSVEHYSLSAFVKTVQWLSVGERGLEWSEFTADAKQCDQEKMRVHSYPQSIFNYLRNLTIYSDRLRPASHF